MLSLLWFTIEKNRWPNNIVSKTLVFSNEILYVIYMFVCLCMKKRHLHKHNMFVYIFVWTWIKFKEDWHQAVYHGGLQIFRLHTTLRIWWELWTQLTRKMYMVLSPHSHTVHTFWGWVCKAQDMSLCSDGLKLLITFTLYYMQFCNCEFFLQ